MIFLTLTYALDRSLAHREQRVELALQSQSCELYFSLYRYPYISNHAAAEILVLHQLRNVAKTDEC